MRTFKTVKAKIAFTYVLVFVGTLMLLNILIYFLSLSMTVKAKKELMYTNRSFFLEGLKAYQEEGVAVSIKDIEAEIEKIRWKYTPFYIMVENQEGESVGKIPENITFEEKYNELILAEGEERKEYFYYVELYEYEGMTYKIYYVLVADYHEYFKVLIKVLIAAELLGIIVAIILGIKLGDKVVGPINEISETTERINVENLSERLPPVKGQHEIARLSQVINLMLERLNTTFEEQKKFMSNVSHELRTPVAVMKGYLDLYRRVGPENKEIVEEAIDAIEEENENMRLMIEKLLFLARREADEYSLNVKSVDMQKLLEKLRKDYTSIDKNRDIKVVIEENPTVLCDEGLVIQMLRALIDNGIKYGGENGLEIGFYRDGEDSVVYVEDFGEGMTQEETNRIFDRFYKRDDSRNRDDGSMGLGLSIVKKIAEIHGCRIRVKSKKGVGSRFEVVFTKGVDEDEEDTYSRG